MAQTNRALNVEGISPLFFTDFAIVPKDIIYIKKEADLLLRTFDFTFARLHFCIFASSGLTGEIKFRIG